MTRPALLAAADLAGLWGQDRDGLGSGRMREVF